MNDGTAITLDVVDRSIIETINDFVLYRSGFRGDTGVQHHLNHRLMVNLPNGGKYLRADGVGTLRVQQEWCTKLLYRNSRACKSSPGSLDLTIPKPDQLDLPSPQPLVHIECGRNKAINDLLSAIDVPRDRVPEPSDITKLLREIKFAGLPYGYALEFYDNNPGRASELIRELGRRIPESECTSLRVAVLGCGSARRPILRFFPGTWEEHIRLRFRLELDRIENVTIDDGKRLPTLLNPVRLDRVRWVPNL